MYNHNPLAKFAAFALQGDFATRCSAANVATTLADALKVYYINGQNEQLNMKSVIYNKFVKQAQMDVTGKSYTYLLHVGRNVSAGTGMAEGGQFPTPGNQGWKTTVITPKMLGSSIEITGPAIKAAKANLGAFIDGVKSEVDGVTNDNIRSLNRQLNGNGNGALAYWVVSDDSSPALINDGQGNAFIQMDPGSTNQIDLVATSDNSTLHGTNIPLVIGAENATTWSASWASGTISGSAPLDYPVKTGTLGKELMGIDGIINAADPPLGALQGLAVATYSYWKAQSYTNSGTLRDLSLKLMQKPLTRIDTNSGFSQSDIKFLLTNGPVFDQYCNALVADQRHVNTMTLEGGQTAVDFNGRPLIVDPQTRQNTIFYCNPKTMDLLTSSDGFTWADFENNSQFMLKPGSGTYYDAYQAYQVFYGEFVAKARNGNACLGDIAQS